MIHFREQKFFHVPYVTHCVVNSLGNYFSTFLWVNTSRLSYCPVENFLYNGSDEGKQDFVEYKRIYEPFVLFIYKTHMLYSTKRRERGCLKSTLCYHLKTFSIKESRTDSESRENSYPVLLTGNNSVSWLPQVPHKLNMCWSEWTIQS